MWLRKLLGLLFVLSVFTVQAQAGALLEAANYNDIDMARQLLDQGADINAKNKVEKTPTMLCQADSVKPPVREISAAATNPAEAQRYFNRGLAAVEIAKTPDDYDLAISEFQKARTLDPGRADICYNLGLIQEKAGKFKEAASSLRQYLKLAPHSPDAETVRTLVDKLEFKAEQVITDEEALDIFVSLTDSSQWQLNGITNANVFNKNMGWVKSFSRSSKPGFENRLFFEFNSGGCCPTLKGVCPGDALPIGKSVEFETFYCQCEGSCLSPYKYRLEVISRNKVKMFLKVHHHFGGKTSEATYEFVRR